MRAWLPLRKSISMGIFNIFNSSIKRHSNLAVRIVAELSSNLEDSSATILTARLLCLLIEELKMLNIPIEIDFLSGNHARILPKLTSKRMGYFTADYTIAQIVDHYFE